MAVYSAISFAGLSIDAFTNVSFNASFHDEFTTQMAAAANLTSDLVVITECVAGSVQVSSVAYFTSSFLEADPAAFEALVTSDCGSIFDSSYGNVSAVAIETRPAVATFSPPPPNPPPPSPPPAPSPPPPTVSLAVTAATVAYYQGSANRTCLHAAPSGMFSLSVWTASGPSSLTWSFTNSTSCDGSACSVSFCGFQLGAYVLHGYSGDGRVCVDEDECLQTSNGGCDLNVVRPLPHRALGAEGGARIRPAGKGNATHAAPPTSVPREGSPRAAARSTDREHALNGSMLDEGDGEICHMCQLEMEIVSSTVVGGRVKRTYLNQDMTRGNAVGPALQVVAELRGFTDPECVVARDWTDDEPPLWYQLKYEVVGHPEKAGMLNDFQPQSHASTIMAEQGDTEQGYAVHLTLQVRDALGAVASNTTRVLVRPADVADEAALTSYVDDKLEQAASQLSNGDASTPVLLVDGLTAMLEPASQPSQPSARHLAQTSSDGEAASKKKAQREDMMDFIAQASMAVMLSDESMERHARSASLVVNAPEEVTSVLQSGDPTVTVCRAWTVRGSCDSETRPSIFYTGCTNTTCVVFDMGNTNFTTIELQTFEVPLGAPNLAWSFEAGATMRCGTSVCSITLCGFSVGSYFL
eukprot:gene29044-36104_t